MAHDEGQKSCRVSMKAFYKFIIFKDPVTLSQSNL